MTKKTFKVFAENLNYFLKKKGWTQSDLSRASGVSNAYLSDILRGKGNPSIDRVELIAKGLQAPSSLFLLPTTRFKYIVNAHFENLDGVGTDRSFKMSMDDFITLANRHMVMANNVRNKTELSEADA